MNQLTAIKTIVVKTLVTFIIFLSFNSNNLSLASTRQLSHQQQLFIQAEKSLKKQDFTQFDQLIEKLADYPLLDYLQRDYLIQKLSVDKMSKSLASEINDFLQTHSEQVVSRKLRYRWLVYLAENQQKESFLRFYQGSSSTPLKCRFLQFSLENNLSTDDFYPEIEKLWLTSRSLPKACDPLIALWKNAGGLTEILFWQRMLLAAEKKQYRLVRYLNQQRASKQQASGELLVQLSRQPKKLLSMHFTLPISEYNQAIIYQGLNQLAWQSPLKAIDAWKNFDTDLKLSNDQTEKLKRSIGLSLALKSAPEAKNWLISLKDEPDPSVDQWLLSSALTSEDWSMIEYVARQKKHRKLDLDKWRYWRAISTKKSGFANTSNGLLQSLASNRSYYGFLAAFNQNQAPQLNMQSHVVKEEQLTELEKRENAINAKQFFQMGKLPQARSEWNQLLKLASPNEWIALAQLAHQWGWQHQSILAFAKSKQMNDVQKRFPFYLPDLFRSESSKHQIPISWAYAITRQESAFKEDAGSHAGAQGLMQLMPATAKRVARRQAQSNRISYQSKKQLLTPEINVKLGVAHLKEMLDYYQGHPVLATAAYNAGQHRVDQWLANNDIADSILWIEQIPYKETRDYVKNVLTYQQIYSQLAHSSDSFLSSLANYPIPTQKKSNVKGAR